MTVSAERQLLFGLLALQNGFINRDALVAAFGAWTADKSRPLEDILFDQGHLDSNARNILISLVDLHLACHGQDPSRSLQSLSSTGGAAAALQAIPDPDVQASLVHLPETPPSPPTPSPPSRIHGPSSEFPSQRFRVLRHHARDNLGVVYVARDLHLNRQVALKEIKEHRVNDPSRSPAFF